jgi:hypothetical protein
MPAVPAGVVRRNPLIAAIEARLNTGLPVTTPATMGYLSEPVDVPTLDPAGHVQRYWVLHPFVGAPSLEQDLAETAIDLEWPFQITIAAGFSRDAYALASDVDALLYRWTPTVTGYLCGPLKPPPGYDPGPARPDVTVKPHRFFLPLQYRTTVTRAV